MKIYHTETQADYDALMIELEKRGNETLPEDYWSVFETATTVIVRTKSEEISERKKGTTYFDLGRICSRYPGVPITGYKAADQEAKSRESGSVRYINTVCLPNKKIQEEFTDLFNKLVEKYPDEFGVGLSAMEENTEGEQEILRIAKL